jgi:transcriptional regulator with XRE-family HTH domain
MSESRSLKEELKDEEYRYAYAEDYLNTHIALQIKVLREQRQMTQKDLANKIGTWQAGISRLENINYSSWKTKTLKKVARALGVRLHISFETFGTLLNEAAHFSRATLERPDFTSDPVFLPATLGRLEGAIPLSPTSLGATDRPSPIQNLGALPSGILAEVEGALRHNYTAVSPPSAYRLLVNYVPEPAGKSWVAESQQTNQRSASENTLEGPLSNVIQLPLCYQGPTSYRFGPMIEESLECHGVA